MALTHDEIREILELYGKGYSGRKIANKTQHSEVTIYKLIRLAKKRALNLRGEGMKADQIANQLDYPESFVNRVIEESDVEQEEEGRDELEAEETAEELETTNKLDVKADWDKFRKDLEIEQRKDKISREATKLVDNLKRWGLHFRKEGVIDVNYERRETTIIKELEDFLLTEIYEIDSLEALSDVECISKEIYKRIPSLIEEYRNRASAMKEAREAREKACQKALSDKLLNSKIDIPMFPAFVKEGVKKRLLVRNVEEASMVGDALSWMANLIEQDSNSDPKVAVKMWQTFTDTIRVLGWQYMEDMAANFRE